jgi:hypothetical protein
MGSAQGRESGSVRMLRRDGEEVDIAGVRAKFAKGSRARQVQAFDKTRSLGINRFQVGIDHSLNPMVQQHHAQMTHSRKTVSVREVAGVSVVRPTSSISRSALTIARAVGCMPCETACSSVATTSSTSAGKPAGHSR